MKWRTVARQKNPKTTRKDSRWSGDVHVRPPGDGGMVHKVLKNSDDGESGLGRRVLVGPAAIKTAGYRTTPEDHHNGLRPRLRGC